MKTRLFLVAALLVVFQTSQANIFPFGLFGSGGGGKQLTTPQVEQVKSIVRQYWIDHPESLIEAIKSLQKYQIVEHKKEIQNTITQNAAALFSSPASPVIGNPKGDIIIVEFMAYPCKHCQDMGPIIEKSIKADPNLAVVIKELPIFGAESEYAAKAALASQKQGKFLEFHRSLLSQAGPLNKAKIIKIALSVGLNIKKLKADMQDKMIEQQIKGTIHLAQQLAIAGTPAFIVSDRQGIQSTYIPGAISLEDLQKTIVRLRQQGNKSQQGDKSQQGGIVVGG